MIYTAHWDHLGRDPSLSGRPDLQRRRRQRLGRGRAAGDRRGLRPGPAAAPEVDPVPRRHRRGEGPAGGEVLRRAPALPARSDARRHQHGRDQPLGPDHRHPEHRPGPRPSTTSSPTPPGSTGGPSSPTPSPRRASTTAPTTSSSPSKASRRSTPRAAPATSASPTTSASRSATSTPRTTTTRSPTR